MKKKENACLWIITGVVLVALVLAIFIMVFDNSSNTFGHNNKDVIEWFEDTGIMVVNSENKVYHIVSDPNGWLYYSSCHDGDLIPVLNAIGTPIKDVSVFEN